MKGLLLSVGSSLLFFSLAAQARILPEQIPNPLYSQDQYQNAHSMFDTFRNDLYRAETDAYPNYLGDRPRFGIAHK